MPTFESYILGAPVGFVHGCAALLKLEAEEATGLIERIVGMVKKGNNDVGTAPEARAISFIARSRDLASPKPSAVELASVLDSNTVLSRDLIAVFATTLDASDSVVSASELPKCDELVDFKWRLGVAISSSSCKNLMSPYVSITFAVRDKGGNKVYRSAELTYKEFQEFSDTFREVARVMDDM